jgi:MFS family permease
MTDGDHSQLTTDRGQGSETNRRLATLGVLIGILLSAVDGTVVTTAMPTIVQTLGGLELYSWVIAVYLLFTAVTIPLYGRLADIYGRKKLFVLSLGVFIIGSVLCGTATSMVQLIAFRAIQGSARAGCSRFHSRLWECSIHPTSAGG